MMMNVKSINLLFQSVGYFNVLGVQILCRHNFEHNWSSKATSIMLA